ncbi:MAG: tetratricopeptide repeat protein [Pirellulales bacterium]|nr:tetratricopeptide repeat protein [Pirellulales bacterium]
MNRSKQLPDNELLTEGARIAFVGRLAAMSHKDAAIVIARHGARCVPQSDARIDLIVVGEVGVPLGEPWGKATAALLSTELVDAVSQGAIKLVAESDFWQQLGVVEHTVGSAESRLFTAGMLADVLNLPVAVIRRWQRRGLIRPVKEVRRLAYFDFQDVAAARQLAALVGQGVSPARIERQLSALAKFVPGVNRPLAQLAVLVEGRNLLLRSGEGLVDAAGQRRFDFESTESAAFSSISLPRSGPTTEEVEAPEFGPSNAMAQQLAAEAERLEEEGELTMAAESYRAALAAGGPSAEINFALAELLYRQGDVAAARERYYATLELDEDYVEARANLGCVLLEQHEPELAVAAFEGALASHPEYPDAHYHLARTLDALGHDADAEAHWREFLLQAPASPWAEEARSRLDEQERMAK